MNIGQRIKERRIELGLSVDELAAKLGKNRSTVYRYESGAIENFPLDVLPPLAKALETTSAYLMGWSEDEIDYMVEIPTNAETADKTDSILVEIQKLELDESQMERLLQYAKFLKSYKED